MGANRAGVVGVDIEPNLPLLGSRLDSFAKNLRPLGLRVDVPDFGRDVETQTGRSKRALQSLGDTGERELGRIESKAKLSSGSLIAIGAGGIAAGSKLLGALKPAADAASDLNETVAYGEQVFGSAFGAISKFADGAANKLGQSRRQAIGGATDFATFGKAAGLAGDDLVGFSTGLVQLASDLASAKNTKPEEAITAISAALRGESEPIRNYGVLLDDATLRQEAFALGITKTTKDALTPQQKVLAAQSAIFKQTTDAQGDFARTSDSAANAQRVAAAEWENAQAKLGQGLTPVIATAAKTLTTFLDVLDKVPGGTAALGVGLAGLGGAAILGGGVSYILGAVKAVKELRAGSAEAGATAVAANDAIATSSTRAATATAATAAAYDAVTVSATRAAAAATAGAGVSTAATVGSGLAMSGNWQYARPRSAPAIGSGARALGSGVIDVTSREVLALGSGVTQSTSAVAASTGVVSKWTGALKSAGTGAANLVGKISPATAGIAAFTIGTAALSIGLEKANAQTAEGIKLLTQIGNLRSLQAAFDPTQPERFGKSVTETAKILSETQYVAPQNWMDRIGAATGTYDLSIFGDSQLSGNQERAAIALIDELKASLDGLNTAQGRQYLDGVKTAMLGLGVSSKDADAKLKPLYDQLNDTDAAKRASGALGEVTDEVERLGVKIDPTASKWANFATVLGGIFDPIQNALSAQEALADGQETLAKAQKKYEDIVNGNTEGLKSAAEALRSARDDLAKAVAETGPGSKAARDAAGDVRDALRAYRDLQVEIGKGPAEGDFFDPRTQDLQDAYDKILDTQEKLKEIESGNSDQVVSAKDRVTEAQQRYNDELAKTGPNSEEAQAALEDVQDAQANMIPLIVANEQAQAALREEIEKHPEAIQASIDQVNEWQRRGLISVEVANRWRQELLRAAEAAQALTDSLPQNTSPATTNYGSADTQERRAGSSPAPAPAPKPPQTMTIPEGKAAGLPGVTYPQVATAAKDSQGRSWKWDPAQLRWVAQFASGGVVPGFTLGDTVPAMLTPGEGVVNRQGMAALGADNLHALNRGNPLSSATADEIRGLRGDMVGLTAFLMRQAAVGGGSELLAPILVEIADLLRSERVKSAREVRASAVEFA